MSADLDNTETEGQRGQDEIAEQHPDTRSAVSVSFLENRKLLKRFLTRFLYKQQDIEDVVQETWLRAFTAEQKTKIEQPRAFLFRIAKNIALNELKRKSRDLCDYIEDCDERVVLGKTNTLESEIESQESLGLYCEAIAALPEGCRRVYLMRKIYGLRHREIAETLGITVSAVEKHLAKGALACRAFIMAREDGAACGETSIHDLPTPAGRNLAKRKKSE